MRQVSCCEVAGGVPRLVGPVPCRVMITDGWFAADLLPAVGSVSAVSDVTFGLGFGALRARVRRA